MKIAKLLRVCSWMSSNKPRPQESSALAEAKIKELFGETEPVSAEAVNFDKILLRRSQEEVE
jgi:hypothetical protein